VSKIGPVGRRFKFSFIAAVRHWRLRVTARDRAVVAGGAAGLRDERKSKRSVSKSASRYNAAFPAITRLRAILRAALLVRFAVPEQPKVERTDDRAARRNETSAHPGTSASEGSNDG
jgi:hypothetical protein